jgi:GDP-L-fucose synthase
MTDYWQGKRVLCTGSSGFLGKPLCLALKQRGAIVLTVPRGHRDLRITTATYMTFRERIPIDIVFHLAADVGGIADNISRPSELLSNNVLINTNVVDACVEYKVGKLIALGSSCAYPLEAPLPFVEDDYLKGEPEPTNAPYAYSKRLLLTHLQAARQQYGLPFTYLILANLYGEDCDTNPETAHVIGALVRKFYEAMMCGNEDVDVWGTGKATRDFLNIHDAVLALIAAGEHESTNDAINIGSGAEEGIESLVYEIVWHTGYSGNWGFDRSKPDGQARRLLNIAKANEVLDWRPLVSLHSGIRMLNDWYRMQRKELARA